MSHKVSVVECGNEGHSLSYLMRKGRPVFHSVIPRVDAGMQCIRICTAGGIKALAPLLRITIDLGV